MSTSSPRFGGAGAERLPKFVLCSVSQVSSNAFASADTEKTVLGSNEWFARSTPGTTNAHAPPPSVPDMARVCAHARAQVKSSSTESASSSSSFSMDSSARTTSGWLLRNWPQPAA